MRTLDRVKGYMKRRGFEIYSRPYELNIVSLRNKDYTFTDEIHVFYKINARNWNYHIYEGITDSATIWQGIPPFPKTPLLLKEGQYKNAYKIGRHKGKDIALVQVKPVTVLKGFNRVPPFTTGTVLNGLFGIDIITIADTTGDIKVAKEDEGCQVVLSNESFQEFMESCIKHQQLYGNEFSYTLIDFRGMKRKAFGREFFMVASFLTSFIIGFILREAKGGKK